MEITQQLLEKISRNSLYTIFGIRVEAAKKGKARSRLWPDPGMCWPFPGQPHGGVLFTLMDSTMAWALFSQLDTGYNCATIHLDIHYTHPARGTQFSCTAEVTHRTRHIGFLYSDIYDETDVLVATGQATFRIVETDVTITD